MKASGSKNKKLEEDPPPKKKASEQSPAPRHCWEPFVVLWVLPGCFFCFFFAILVADEGFRIQKLEKTGVRHQRKDKGCEENPGLRAPGSDILNNNLKDKNAPRSGDRTRCFFFFASLVADEGLWMQKLAKTEVRHPKKKNKGREENPRLRAPGSDILNNNLKDKNAPRSGDRTRCFSFFASLVADEGLWMQKTEEIGVTPTKNI